MLIKTLKIYLILSLCLYLCACGTEPEDRSFVTAVGITGDGACILTANGSITDNNDNEKNKGVIYSDGNSIYTAIQKNSDKVSGELFFGQTVVCVMGTDLLADRSKLLQTVDFLQTDTQISRRVLLLASDDPVDVLSATTNELDTADFVITYYKTHTDVKGVELDSLCRTLAESGDLILPRITTTDNGILFDGGVMLTNGVLHTDLTEDDLYNTAWLIDDNAKPKITVITQTDTLDVTTLDKRVKVKTDGEDVSFDIKLKIKADTDNTEQIAKSVANQIKKSAEKGAELLQRNNCDVVGVKHAFEIRGVRDFNNWDFENLTIEINVKVEVE